MGGTNSQIPLNLAQAQPCWDNVIIAPFYKEKAKVPGHWAGEGKEGPHPDIRTRSGTHPLFVVLPATPSTSAVW